VATEKKKARPGGLRTGQVAAAVCGRVAQTREEATCGFHAASGEAGDVRGRSMFFGHLASSGQFWENQRIARSKLPVARSRPEAMRSSVMPALKTMVETRERESCRAKQ
jgi:hypothetical protein